MFACSGGSPDCTQLLTDAAESVRERWPTAAAAREEGAAGCVWYWSHNRVSVDGFGVTLVMLSEEPGVDDVLDFHLDVHAGGRLDSPSLLFFDQTEGPIEDWKLIGMGYHFDYQPCQRPTVSCMESRDFFVHEAGYHKIVLGDGGMTIATPEDLVDGSGAIMDSDGGAAVVAVAAPERRWSDAPNRVAVDPGGFFYADDAACGCVVDTGIREPGDSHPPTRGTEAPTGGCGSAALLWLPCLILGGAREDREGNFVVTRNRVTTAIHKDAPQLPNTASITAASVCGVGSTSISASRVAPKFWTVMGSVPPGSPVTGSVGRPRRLSS